MLLNNENVDYLSEWPVHYYEIEDIMDDAYYAADFELQEIPSHKDVFIDAIG